MMRAITRPSLETSCGAEPDVGGALHAQGVLRAVALGGVIGAIEQRVDRLLAFAVDDAQRLAAPDDARPRPLGRHVVR